MKHYRLLCLQNGNYMATGYNAHGLKDLFEQYASYKSNDWDENEQLKYWNEEMSDEQKLNFIKEDEFEIEESDKLFEEMN
jgi:hypothetical protein